MKCSACAKGICEGDYDKRHYCLGDKEGIDCSCYCHRTKTGVFFSTLLSVGVGAAAVAGGVALTVATGGMAAVVGGAALAGSGTSLVISPLQKLATKESITFTDSAKEVALGATIGAITGPIGAAGSIVSKTAPVAVQIGTRVAAGSAAGATSGVIAEVARGIQGEDISLGSVAKSAGFGAIVGTVGGASSQLANGISGKVSNEAGRAVTRIAVQGSSAAGTDAVIQLVQNGEIDPQRLLLNTTGQLTVATTAEISSSVTQRSSAYANRLNDRHMKQSDLKPEEIKEIKPIIEEANTNNVKKGVDRVRRQMARNQQELKEIRANKQQHTLTADDYKRLKARPMIGENNIHPLEKGKIAADFGPNDGPFNRAPGRVVMEKHKGNYIYSKHSRTHDYNAMKGSILKDIPDPLNNVLRNDQIQTYLLENDDDDDDGYCKNFYLSDSETDDEDNSFSSNKTDVRQQQRYTVDHDKIPLAMKIFFPGFGNLVEDMVNYKQKETLV